MWKTLHSRSSSKRHSRQSLSRANTIRSLLTLSCTRMVAFSAAIAFASFCELELRGNRKKYPIFWTSPQTIHIQRLKFCAVWTFDVCGLYMIRSFFRLQPHLKNIRHDCTCNPLTDKITQLKQLLDELHCAQEKFPDDWQLQVCKQVSGCLVSADRAVNADYLKSLL